MSQASFDECDLTRQPCGPPSGPQSCVDPDKTVFLNFVCECTAALASGSYVTPRAVGKRANCTVVGAADDGGGGGGMPAGAIVGIVVGIVVVAAMIGGYCWLQRRWGSGGKGYGEGEGGGGGGGGEQLGQALLNNEQTFEVVRQEKTEKPGLILREDMLNGLVVTGVKKGSPCERAGMKRGMALVSVNGRPVATKREFGKRVLGKDFFVLKVTQPEGAEATLGDDDGATCLDVEEEDDVCSAGDGPASTLLAPHARRDSGVSTGARSRQLSFGRSRASADGGGFFAESLAAPLAGGSGSGGVGEGSEAFERLLVERAEMEALLKKYKEATHPPECGFCQGGQTWGLRGAAGLPPLSDDAACFPIQMVQETWSSFAEKEDKLKKVAAELKRTANGAASAAGGGGGGGGGGAAGQRTSHGSWASAPAGPAKNSSINAERLLSQQISIYADDVQAREARKQQTTSTFLGSVSL